MGDRIPNWLVFSRIPAESSILLRVLRLVDWVRKSIHCQIVQVNTNSPNIDANIPAAFTIRFPFAAIAPRPHSWLRGGERHLLLLDAAAQGFLETKHSPYDKVKCRIVFANPRTTDPPSFALASLGEPCRNCTLYSSPNDARVFVADTLIFRVSLLPVCDTPLVPIFERPRGWFFSNRPETYCIWDHQRRRAPRTARKTIRCIVEAIVMNLTVRGVLHDCRRWYALKNVALANDR